MKLETRIEKSIDTLKSEDLVNKAYDGLLAIMDLKPKQALVGYQCGGGIDIHMSGFYPVVNGIYIPGTVRNFYTGYFDLKVDNLPNQGCVYIETNDENCFAYMVIKRIPHLPKHMFHNCFNTVAVYEATYVALYYGQTGLRYADKGKFLINDVCHFEIDSNGYIHAALDIQKRAACTNTQEIGTVNYFASGALNLLADREYLWLVEVEEEMHSKNNLTAKVTFGIDIEYIKSMLYARELPLTAAGRKRPILHWVRAHKRRLKKGIDVDVIKHLRGITEMEMGGLSLRITQPVKKVKHENI